ncbi:Mur ligase family protein [Ferroacidibacillus organovorans]|uniref:Mur ligase family protein n=1 Tax=Ferroacidibacillus organovorans TaxID=1765683 RepID=UPI0015C43D1F|nr:Mur ligase family protein [Ferroacidibacillus organovorans]
MDVRSWIAFVVASVTAFVLRVTKRAGTSLPGYLATRISPNLLFYVLAKLDRCVIVTGTNGKTTTNALLKSLVAQDEAWISNAMGANLLQGILSALLPELTWRGQLRVKRAILEVDEATLPRLTQRFQPDMIIVTNVMRDQLDRYGEVDATLGYLYESTRDETVLLVLNADDPLAASLGKGRLNTFYFGLSDWPEDDLLRQEVRDGAFCLQCGGELLYTRTVFGQMGHYHCPICLAQRPFPQFSMRVRERQEEVEIHEEIRLQSPIAYRVTSPLLGIYNAYNLLAACSAARLLGVNPLRFEAGLAQFTAPIGRMQTFPGNPPRILALIKNPTGATMVLRSLEGTLNGDPLCFVINDADADGRDVSWLWDIDMESFVLRSPHVSGWYCAGTRGADMALRLKYAGINPAQIQLLENAADTLKVNADEGGSVYILCTYTALHPLANRLEAMHT